MSKNMNLFVAASYSSHVDYDTGLVHLEYKDWLEGNLTTLEKFGHKVICALRIDDYRINDQDPAQAFTMDFDSIKTADGMVAFVDSKAVSAGVQSEIGGAAMIGKPLVFVHDPHDKLAYFNSAIVRAGAARAVTSPLDQDPFDDYQTAIQRLD